MVRLGTTTNILMELRKICQHPYLSEPELENTALPEKEQHRRLIEASGKLKFLKQLLPRLKERGFRVLLFSQFKIALDMIEDFLYGEEYKYLRLDGDVAQVNRQKDMDKFNAPDSDYFILLLTTRAGGVGINLATADAVIMFDPDFNPHQDLQAISRSHRFGQKKRVLVFRLMAENSVENRIINNGKRKMVLDHLVVQQMGKETEEGEVDNLILFGAEEIAKSNPDDTSADRVWTPELIDELIDGAEKEAEEQAREQEERDAVEAAEAAEAAEEAKADGENGAGNKKKGGFSFARIWETKSSNTVKPADLAEPDEPEPFGDDDVWEKFLSVAEQENQEHEVTIVEGGRTRKVRKLVSYRDQLAALDEELASPKGKKKGKGKATDDDFVATTADSDSDDNEQFFDAVPESLQDLATETATGSRTDLVGHKLNKAERKAIKRREEATRQAQAHMSTDAAIASAQATNAAMAVAGALPCASQPVAGPSTATIHPIQTSPRAAAFGLTHDAGMSMLSNGPIFRPTHPGMLVPAAAPAPPAPIVRPPTLHQGAIHAAKVASARQVLVQLKGLLLKLNNRELLARWYEVANTGMSASARKNLYLPMALWVDNMLGPQGIAPYYTSKGSLDVVGYYINLGDAVRDVTAPGAAPPMPTPPPYRPLSPTTTFLPGPPVNVPAPAQATSSSHMPPPLQPMPRPPPLIVPTPGANQQRPLHPAVVAALTTPVAQMVTSTPQSLSPATPRTPSVQPISQAQTPEITVISRFPSAAPQPAPIVPQPVLATPQPANTNTPTQGTPAEATTPATVTKQAATAPLRTTIAISTTSSASAGARPLPSQAQTHVMQMGDSSRFAPPTPPSGNAMESGQCMWCEGQHQLKDCPRLIPLSELADFERELADREEGEEKQNAVRMIHHMRIAHQQLDFSRRAQKHKAKRAAVAHAKAAVWAPPEDTAPQGATPGARPIAPLPPAAAVAGGTAATANGSSVTASTTNGSATNGSASSHANGGPATQANGNGAPNGHREEEAIVIDDEDETEERPLKRPRVVPEERPALLKRVPSRPTAPVTDDDRGPESSFQGCMICLHEVHHVVRACPIVKAGPKSIERALKRFRPEDSLYSTLSMMHQALMTGTAPSKLPRCPFCNGACGQSVRQCAETRGSRKQLKAKIRELEGPMREAEERLKELKTKRSQMVQAGIHSGADHEAIQDVMQELHKLEQNLDTVIKPALAPLYEAYLSWPNPNQPPIQ